MLSAMSVTHAEQPQHSGNTSSLLERPRLHILYQDFAALAVYKGILHAIDVVNIIPM